MSNYTTNWKDTGVKVCTKCKIEKPMDLFSFSKGYPQWCKECHRQAAREQWNKVDNRTPEQIRAKHLRLNYNLTPEDFALMVLEQGGVCAICKKQNDNLCVDHDHTTGKVRGLLCQKCNSGIGLLNDSISDLENAITYLKRTTPKETK